MQRLSRRIEFLETIDELPEDGQDRVLDLVRCLAAKNAVAGGRRPASLSGALDPEQARLMMKAIDEDCETVDSHGW